MLIGTTGDIRCVLYLRVSSRKQLDGVSLEDQEHLGRIYAQQHGWIVTHVYVEPGRSTFTEDLAKRVAFQELLADARRKKFDIVLVYKLNRFARNVPAQYKVVSSGFRVRTDVRVCLGCGRLSYAPQRPFRNRVLKDRE